MIIICHHIRQLAFTILQLSLGNSTILTLIASHLLCMSPTPQLGFIIILIYLFPFLKISLLTAFPLLLGFILPPALYSFLINFPNAPSSWPILDIAFTSLSEFKSYPCSRWRFKRGRKETEPPQMDSVHIRFHTVHKGLFILTAGLRAYWFCLFSALHFTAMNPNWNRQEIGRKYQCTHPQPPPPLQVMQVAHICLWKPRRCFCLHLLRQLWYSLALAYRREEGIGFLSGL